MRTHSARLWIVALLALAPSAFAQPTVTTGQVIGPPDDRHFSDRRENPFDDVRSDHPVYTFLNSLQKKGILKGYADGSFRGGRTLTRFELAWALDRAVAWMLANIKFDEGPAGVAGIPGAAGPQGARGPQGYSTLEQIDVTPDDIRMIRDFGKTFGPVIDQLGADLRVFNTKIGPLESQVGALKTDLANLPHINLFTGLGIRSDNANGPYVDQDGRVIGVGGYYGGAGTLNQLPIYNLNLNINKDLPGGANLNAGLAATNYVNMLSGSLAKIRPITEVPAGGLYINNLQIAAPFNAIGRGGNIVIGRQFVADNPFILSMPPTDSYLPQVYFGEPGQQGYGRGASDWRYIEVMYRRGYTRGANDPHVDTRSYMQDGHLTSAWVTAGALSRWSRPYILDGITVRTNFGSVNTTFNVGQFSSVWGTGSTGYSGPFNSPCAGVISPLPPIFVGGNKPIGMPDIGSMVVEQSAGLNFMLPIRLLGGGFARVSIYDFGNPFSTGLGYNNVLVHGADAGLHLTDRLFWNGVFARSNTQKGNEHGVTVHENKAFDTNFMYSSGRVGIMAGYKYIDPLFYAPGYWARIGNWVNPTNIQGPTFRVRCDPAPRFGVVIGGDFFTAAHNRGPGHLTMDDCISRILAGFRWNIAKNFQTTVDWEGVYWSLANSRFGGSGKIHPTEHYITFGTGYNVTKDTVLKLGYQIGDFNGHGSLGGGPGVGNSYNFSSFTGTVNLKF